jgi:hypothetical protein
VASNQVHGRRRGGGSATALSHGRQRGRSLSSGAAQPIDPATGLGLRRNRGHTPARNRDTATGVYGVAAALPAGGVVGIATLALVLYDLSRLTGLPPETRRFWRVTSLAQAVDAAQPARATNRDPDRSSRSLFQERTRSETSAFFPKKRS